MSSTATIHNNEPPSRDRRCGPREPVQQAILVFFAENNWGKLIDLGKSGMSFEFAEAPPLRQRINFKFETMGCTAAQLGGQHFNDSFELAGEVVWTRQFERAAGVRFLDLPENSRPQIQNLASLETSGSAAADEATRPDVLVPESEPAEHIEIAESLERPAEALFEGEAEGEGTPAEAEAAESWMPPVQDFDSEQIRQILEAPTFEAYKKLRTDEATQNLHPRGSKSRGVRIGLIAVFGSLAVLAAVAVAMRISARWGRRAQAAEQIPSLPASAYQGGRSGPEKRPVGISPQPFVVEVSDANNKKWLLWFDNNLPKSLSVQAVHNTATPSSPAEVKSRATDREKPSTAGRHAALQDSRRVKSQLSHPNTKSLANRVSADVPPVIPDIAAGPSIESASGILNTLEAPVPVGRAPSVGGMVQPARLVKSVPPTYPALARSTRLAGNVTLDALIDADGNVKDVKVVSGPVLLQQTARDAVRQWKYEPARLDGRPVAMHLNVTVKFSSQ